MADLLAPIERMVQALIRVGRVSSVNAQRHTAQVLFVDDLVSYDLQFLVTRHGDYSLPAKDTPVVCLLLPGAHGDGFVLGAIYTEADPAPDAGVDARVIAGEDIRLGSKDATDKIALAPPTNSNFDALKARFDAIEAVITTVPPVAEPGNGAPSAFQAALAAAIAANPYPDPDDVSAEKVKAE